MNVTRKHIKMLYQVTKLNHTTLLIKSTLAGIETHFSKKVNVTLVGNKSQRNQR